MTSRFEFQLMRCLCGHFESCKYCSPSYQRERDPVWLRARLEEAVLLLAECSGEMGFEDTAVGEKVLEWLKAAPE
jgi:hypothetical protein